MDWINEDDGSFVGRMCRATGPDGRFGCTRDADHSGPHTAQGMVPYTIYRVWDDDRTTD